MTGPLDTHLAREHLRQHVDAAYLVIGVDRNNPALQAAGDQTWAEFSEDFPDPLPRNFLVGCLYALRELTGLMRHDDDMTEEYSEDAACTILSIWVICEHIYTVLDERGELD